MLALTHLAFGRHQRTRLIPLTAIPLDRATLALARLAIAQLAIAHLAIAHLSPGRHQRTRLIRLMITPWVYQLHPPAKTRRNETEPQILRGRQLPVFPCLLPARFRLRANRRGNGERCMPQLRLSLCKCNHTGSSARCQCMFMIRYSCNIWISWLVIQNDLGLSRLFHLFNLYIHHKLG